MEMKQESSNIDKIFRDKLYDYKSNPKAETWKKIAEKLPSHEPTPRREWRRLLYPAIAAATILILSLSLFYFIQKETAPTTPVSDLSTISIKNDTAKNIQEKTEVAPEKKTNPPAEPSVSLKEEKTGDEKKEIRLPDGSKIIMNRNSKIRYSTNFKKERKVYLHGEAFFEVKPNANLPFIVEGNLSKTKVLGTSFIINSNAHEGFDEINVVSGKVSFGQLIDNNEVLISEGNMGTLKENKIEQTAIKDANYNAWLTEKIIFKNTKLKEVFKVLEEYYNVSVKTKNPKILNCEFSGQFEKSDINEILEVLAVSFSLSFNKESNNYMLSGKGCK